MLGRPVHEFLLTVEYSSLPTYDCETINEQL